MAQTCRYFGISRQTFYAWLRRYQEKGLEGLRDRSSRPRVSPNATSAEVVGKIIYLRQHYHFGPEKISSISAATRADDQPLGGVADPETARSQPAADLATTQALSEAVAAL